MERYTTKDEIGFIKGLKTFTPRGKLIGRKTLLHLYLHAAALRRNWGEIDKAIILKFAESEFEMEARR